MITVLGSINVDLIATAERLPEPGETVAGDTLLTAAGGKGANQAIAARRAGAETAMVGATGSDSYTEVALENLINAGVNLDLTRSTTTNTGTALIVVDAAGENIITVVAGANNMLTETDAEAAVNRMREGDTLLMQLEIPTAVVEAASQMAAAKNISTILNTAPLTAHAQQLASNVDVVIANENEFIGLQKSSRAQQRPLQQSMREYINNTPQVLVVTLGAKGAVVAHSDQFYECKALDIDPIDTVGAGDSFSGYFAEGLDAGLEISEALQRAAAAGSLACLTRGAQSAIPTREQVDAAL